MLRRTYYTTKEKEQRIEMPSVTDNEHKKLSPYSYCIPANKENKDQLAKKFQKMNNFTAQGRMPIVSHDESSVMDNDSEKYVNFRYREMKVKEITNEYTDKRSQYKQILQLPLRSCINPDLIIIIGKNQFYCHRSIFQPYTLFFSNAEDNEECSRIYLPEEKVTVKALEIVYNWMLLGGDEPLKLLNRKSFLEVSMVVQYLEIKELQTLCKDIIEDEDVYSEENAFFLFMEAYRLHNEEVMDLMLPRIQTFFPTLVSTQDFVYLDIDVLSRLLQSNYICVHSEMEVFLSGVKWLTHNWEERSKYAYEVMKNIRFALMTPPQLVDIRRNPDSPEILQITSNPKVQQLIDDGMAFSVKVNCTTGAHGAVTKECQKLGLEPPSMRNWDGTDKNYRKYQEFLKDLEIIKNHKSDYLRLPAESQKS